MTQQAISKHHTTFNINKVQGTTTSQNICSFLKQQWINCWDF